MLKSDAAAYLAGVTQVEGAQASAPTNLHVITGEVGQNSEDGKTTVSVDGLVFSEEDSQEIEMDTLGGLEEGDIATIILTGEAGHGMTPLAIGAVGSVDRINAKVIETQLLLADKADIQDLTAATARIDDLEADHVTVTDLTAATGRISDLEADNVTINGRLQAAELDIDGIQADYLKAADLQAEQARVGNLLANKANVSDLTAATGRIGDLEADHVSVSDFQAEQANIDTLQANTADIATIRANSAKVQNLTAAQLEADHATIGTLDTTYATIANLNAANGRITNLESTKANISDLEADYITADEIEATYMHANMSNSDVAWIENGTIKNGAIVSAMINDVSANKLTAGTINGSVINVTNLNADNITTGTINGQRIGEGSLSLSKLEDDVYTETEVNNIVDGLNDRIDGAIETHTGTAVPTLNNPPASSWNTTKLRDEHVGDVYYVVNSQSQQNGYCYRFTKSGGTYSWQLIKDSDVTAALSRLTTAEGKITTFDSDISTLKTDTGTLTTRTTDLETRMSDAEDDILDKVDTTTFNEVSDTVDAHTRTISQHTNALSNKADNSTVTAVTNRVSKNEQDISGINTTIGELQDTVETKADGSTVSTISSKLNTVSDTVDGHTQNITSLQNTVSQKADGSTVSTLQSDYATFKQQTTQFESTIGTRVTTVENEFDNLEIGGRNLLYNTEDWSSWACTPKATVSDGVLTTANTDTSAFQRANGWFTLDKADIVDRVITISFEAKKTDETALNTMCFQLFTTSAEPKSVTSGNIPEGTRYYVNLSASSGPKVTIENATEINATTWTKVTITFKPSEVLNTAYTEYEYLAMYIGINNRVGSAQYRRLKAEFANRASDWTPAPEDIESRVDKAESSITQNATNINAKVSKNDVINQINLSTEGVLIDADRVEIDGTAVFNAIKPSTDAAYDAKGSAATVQSNLDNIVIGGRNLLAGTDVWLTTFNSYSTCGKGSETIPAGSVVTVSVEVDADNLVWDTTSGTHRIGFETYLTKTGGGYQYFGVWAGNAISESSNVVEAFTGSIHKRISKTFTLLGDFEVGRSGYVYTQGVAQGTVKVGRAKIEYGNRATDWSPSEGDIVKRTQRIYYRWNSATAPAAPSAWVTKNDDGNALWTKMHVAITSTHKYIYTCEQYEMADGTLGHTDVLLDNTITVIDGGNIITGSVYATALNASSINTSKTLTVGAMTDEAAATILNSNLQVGGRNLALDSKLVSHNAVARAPYAGMYSNAPKVERSDGFVAIAPKQGGNWTGLVVYMDSLGLAVGDLVAFSCLYEYQGCNADLHFYAMSLDSSGTRIYPRFDLRGSNGYSGNYHNVTQLATISSSNPSGKVWVVAEWSQAAQDAIDAGGHVRFTFQVSGTTEVTSGGSVHLYATKLERGNKPTDWSPAPEDSLAEEQYIYISSASGTTSINKNTTWVMQSSDVQNVWTTKRPTYNSSYPVLFVAKQSKTVGGSVSCTTPVKDDTTTVIDGGHITTGTIDTNRLNAATIKSNIVQTTDLSASKITSGDISADRIKANVIGAINSLTAGQIDAARINASQLTIGQSQVTNLTSDFAHKSDVAWSGTCDTVAGTAAKEVVCDGFTASELTMGATICVRFNAANTSSAAITLNVNGTGAKPISVATGATSATNQLLWASGATIRFMYNTSLGQWRVADTTPTYYSTCSIAEGVAAKTAGCAGCVIFKGVAIHIIMTAANTNTSATLNVNSTGAKAIYYGNTTTRPTTANEYGWKAGATASFVFDGAYWRYADASAMYQSADAAKTASNYITTIDANNGIKIADASPSSATTYLHLASRFLDFIRGGTSMLKAWLDGSVAKVRVGAEQIDGTDTFNTLTDNEGIKLRRGTTVLSQFATNLIELGKNSYNATISLLNNGIEIYATDIDPDHKIHFGKITSGDSYLQFAPWSTVEGDESAYSASAKFGVKHEFTSTRGFGVDDSVNIGGDGFVGLTTALVDSDDVPLAEAGMYAATNMGAGNSEIAIIGDKVFLYDGGGNTSTYYGPFPMSDVASAIPVTLYDNASASASAAATLSESAANFRRLTIFFKDTDGNYSSTEVWSPNGKRVALSLTWINGASTQDMYQRVRWVTISGTTISTYKGSSDSKYRTGQVKLGATASVANSDYLAIVHVIGYR